MKNLTEENRRFVEGALTEGGVVNAAEVVASALEEQRATANFASMEMALAEQSNYDFAGSGQVVNDATLQTINALIDETAQTEEDRAALA